MPNQGFSPELAKNTTVSVRLDVWQAVAAVGTVCFTIVLVHIIDTYAA